MENDWIDRGPPPPLLLQNKATWELEAHAEVTAGHAIPPHWNKSEIKSSLRETAFGKCMYCEAKIEHTSHSEVEHIKPKTEFLELSYEWTNLGYVCRKCNGKKGSFWNVTLPLIDPYSESPEDYLEAEGPMLWAKEDHPRGHATIERIGLNREEIVIDRISHVGDIKRLIAQARNHPDERMRVWAKLALDKRTSSDAEYSFVARALVARHLPTP